MSNKDNISLFPKDVLKLITAYTMMIPLGFIFRKIKSPFHRMLISSIFGNSLVLILYEKASINIYICILINILILKFLDRKKVGKYALIYNMAHNSLINIYRQIYHYNEWRVDSIGVPFMMLIFKHISFAYSYQDFAFIEKEDDNEEKSKEFSKISFRDNYYIYPENRCYIIKNFTIYEYCNYILFYPTIVGGPYIEYNDFKRFINLEDEYVNIPSSLLLSIKRYIFGFSLIVIFYIINPYNKAENIIDYNNEFSIFQKYIFFLLGFFYAVRYFGGFSLIEIGCISCGFSYGKENYEMQKEKKIKLKLESFSSISNSIDTNFDLNSEKISKADLCVSNKCPDELFNKAKVIDCKNLLLVYNPEDFFRHWNIHVHNFLKRNIYLRNISSQEEQNENPQLAKNKRNRASYLTFFLSAYWHGFYPTYFIVFFHFYIYSFIGKQIKDLNSKIDMVTYIPFYKNLIRIIIITVLIPYHCIIFASLDYKILIDLIKTTKLFITVISLILLFILFILNKMIKNKYKKELKKKN